MAQRYYRLLLIGTFLPLCWLLFQVVHELGHVVVGISTGGTIDAVVLYPTAISRTDVSGSFCRLAVVWAGAVVGVLIPLAVWGLLRWTRCRWTHLAQFFAGACLVANGAYLGAGSLGRVGDAGDLISLGVPIWQLWLFGAIAVPLGFCLWNGLGPFFGLGPRRTYVDHLAAYASTGLLVLVIVLEVMLSTAS